MAKKKQGKLVLKESFGEVLHTALRKACDSPPTTVAYNVIKLMPNTIWHEWLDVVWTEFNKIKPTRADAGNALKQAACQYDPGSYFVGERDMDYKKPGSQRDFIGKLPLQETAHRSTERILIERDSWRFIWHGVLELFDEHDWGGFAAYLYYDEREGQL
jgi:hypothetical protein